MSAAYASVCCVSVFYLEPEPLYTELSFQGHFRGSQTRQVMRHHSGHVSSALCQMYHSAADKQKCQ